MTSALFNPNAMMILLQVDVMMLGPVNGGRPGSLSPTSFRSFSLSFALTLIRRPLSPQGPPIGEDLADGVSIESDLCE